jgi:hypothetical protein
MKAGHRQDVHGLARWSTQASRVVAWTGNEGKKESRHVKFLAFTQNVEQVLGMPRLHLRHAFQGSGGQGKTKMSTARRPVSQAGKRGAKRRQFGDVLLTGGLEGFQGDAGSRRGRDGLAQFSAVQAGVRGSSGTRTTLVSIPGLVSPACLRSPMLSLFLARRRPSSGWRISSSIRHDVMWSSLGAALRRRCSGLPPA